MHFVDAKSILSAQNGMNLYRGCTHGCIYCDSRSKCYHIDHAFTDIEVKRNAPQLLEEALKRKRRRAMIGTGSMCDPYMPIEKDLRLTRRCLEIIERYGFGLSILSKSTLILRDLDLFAAIQRNAKCVCQMTLTTYDEKLCRILEPNVSTTRERFEALCQLRDAGIPTVVWLSPFLPFINDTEENLRGLIDYCVEAKVAGILCFGIGVTLREGDREYFYSQLDRYFPGMKERYQKTFGYNYMIDSPNNAKLMPVLESACREHGILLGVDSVFEYLNSFPEEKNAEQLSLFGE